MSPLVPTSTVTSVALGRAKRFSMPVTVTLFAPPSSGIPAVSSDKSIDVDSVVAGVSFDTAWSSKDAALLPAASASASDDGAV